MLEIAGMLNVRSANFAQASRDQTENWIRDANDGQTDVQPRTVALSARADLKANSFKMHAATHIGTYLRGTDFVADNLLGAPGPDGITRDGLRKAMYACPMQADERARMLRNHNKPDIWVNPPTLSTTEKAILGQAGANQDDSLREQQLSKATSLIPVLQALSTAGEMFTIIASLPQSDSKRALEQVSNISNAQLSDTFNQGAYELTQLQKKRKTLYLRAVSGVNTLAVDDTIDDADWSLSGAARINMGTELFRKE